MLCVADHFEPLGCLVREGAEPPQAAARAERLALVDEWVSRYPALAGGLADADGRPPRHTFFCARDDYEAGWMNRVASLCARGFGEVELHLHHRGDTQESLRAKLISHRDTLRREHGLLGEWRNAERGTRNAESGNRSQAPGVGCREGSPDRPPSSPRPSPPVPPASVAYGFVHGNWALCNSRPDGDWCGVDQELAVLQGTGCYADFTFPSAPSPTQPRMVNSIYRATDRLGCPRGHDRGQLVRCHAQVSGFRSQPSLPLLLIQGPLALDWGRRKFGILPRLENGELSGVNPPTEARIRLWARQHIQVLGRPDWIFVKVHTHGCVPVNTRMLLGEPMRRAHAVLKEQYNDGRAWALHYVTAREMYNIVRAAEDGQQGTPGDYRDYEILPPPCLGSS